MRSIATALMLGALAAGCQKPAGNQVGVNPTPPTAREADDVATERAKLTPEDRALVEAQEWCVVSTDQRLGAMGAPIKLMIRDQPVFLCCKGCKRKAEADPEKTLATVAELKAEAKARKDAKK